MSGVRPKLLSFLCFIGFYPVFEGAFLTWFTSELHTPQVPGSGYWLENQNLAAQLALSLGKLKASTVALNLRAIPSAFNAELLCTICGEVWKVRKKQLATSS
jgi:hypothetical protein